MADQGQPGPKPAGWKRDPTGRHFGRWWDGAQWTENVISAEKIQAVDPLPGRPAPSIFDAPPPPARSTASLRPAAQALERRQAALLILGGAGAVAVGSFLPWAKLTAPFIGTISKAGIEGDGMYFLAMAGVIVAATLSFAQKVPDNVGLRRWTVAAMLVLLGLGTALDVADIASRFSEIQSAEDFPVSVSYGSGLWVVAIGVVVATVGWIRMPWAQLGR